MKFDYIQRVVVESQLDVPDIGQCVLKANNDISEEFYLIVKTELGWTEVLEYGPCVPDLELLQMNYQITYNRFEYNQGKLERIIDKFLNNPKRLITQASVVSLADIYDFLINPIDKVFPNVGGIIDE